MNEDVSVIGVVGTSALGVVTLVIDATVPVTGVQGSAAVGTVHAHDIQYAPVTGVSGFALEGTVTVSVFVLWHRVNPTGGGTWTPILE